MKEYDKYLEYKNIISLSKNELDNSLNAPIILNSDKSKSSERIDEVKNEKRRRIKRKLQVWAKSLTAHGFPNIFVTKLVAIKMLWCFSLLISVTYCIYNISREIKNYFNFEYATHLETINQVPILFPVITLCNINPLITKNGEILVKQIFKSEYGIHLSNHSLSPLELIKKLDQINLKARLNAFLPEYGDKNRKLLGHNLEDMLIECFYNHHACTHHDFSWYYSLDYGNCFQFNTGFNSSGHSVEIAKSYKPGSQNGLSLMLFLGESGNRFSNKWSTGLKIFVHKQKLKPGIYEGINIKPSTSTNIGIKRSFEKKLPKPFSSCIDLKKYPGSELFNFIKKQTRFKYRQKDCFDLCLQKLIIDICKCYDLSYPPLKKVTPCLNDSQLKCANDEYMKYINGDNLKCANIYCPLECEEVLYEYTLSSSDYPTEYAYQILKSDHHFSRVNNLTYEKFKERSIRVNIYYSKLNYLSITQIQKFQLMDLLASIGGLLSFFLGVSLLSFVEIVELIVEIFLIINS